MNWILVVEDDALLRMAVVDLIEAAGFGVVEAANADDATRILEQRADVRILFTDVNMPGSMDGLKLADAVRGRWPAIEIIVTSGNRFVLLRNLPARGVFFPKPYDAGQVVAMMRRMAA